MSTKIMAVPAPPAIHKLFCNENSITKCKIKPAATLNKTTRQATKTARFTVTAYSDWYCRFLRYFSPLLLLYRLRLFL